jgi:hypothetical protein
MIYNLKQKNVKKSQHNQNTLSAPTREKNVLIGPESDIYYQTRQKEKISSVIDFKTPPNDEPIEDITYFLE